MLLLIDEVTDMSGHSAGSSASQCSRCAGSLKCICIFCTGVPRSRSVAFRSSTAVRVFFVSSATPGSLIYSSIFAYMLPLIQPQSS